MKREKIKELVVAILFEQTGNRLVTITEKSTFVADLGFDELDFVEVAMEIENEILLAGGDIDLVDGDFDENWEDTQTVKDLIDLIERKLR